MWEQQARWQWSVSLSGRVHDFEGQKHINEGLCWWEPNAKFQLQEFWRLSDFCDKDKIQKNQHKSN